MTPDLSTSRTESSQHLSSPSADELAAAVLLLLGQLESSLAAGQQALVARDLAALNHATAEQARLGREFVDLWASMVASSIPSSIPTECPPTRFVIGELCGAAQRVQYRARVHSALLARSGRQLRMLANLLAGPESAYKNCADRKDVVRALETKKEPRCPA